MTDYKEFFADDVHSFMRSPVREIFKRVDLNAIYSFAGGYPDAATFPLEEVGRLANLVIAKYGAKALQYGATQGVTELREALSRRYGTPVSNIQITTSSQQGIDVCTRVFVNPGDIVLTSAPTYLGAIQSFRSYRADIVNIATASDEQLDRAKMAYVIPDFQNPSGETMTLEQRQELVALARKHNFLIVEDSPYRELRYEGEDVPEIWSVAPERTVHLGSFSKVFAPGFRLGWMFGPEEILDQIYVCKQSLDLCPPIFDQYIAAEYLSGGSSCRNAGKGQAGGASQKDGDGGGLDANLPKTIELYRRKRDLMLSLLERHMPDGVSWTRPEGGLFLFLTLPEGCDTVAMYDRALAAGVAYVAGSFFYIDGSHRNTMRLNFSFVAEDRMEAGVKILSEVCAEEIRRTHPEIKQQNN